jgi:hypothetical protein
MARQYQLPPPPVTGDDPQFAGWAQVVTEVIGNLPQFSVGSGEPNSQVTADPGAIYAQNGSSATSSVWMKQSGVGNSGWIPVV